MTPEGAPGPSRPLTWLDFFAVPTDALLVRCVQTLVEIVLPPPTRPLGAPQFSVLRRHFRQFRDVPVTQLRSTLAVSSPTLLGRYEPPQAEPIVRSLEEAELIVVVETQLQESFYAFDKRLNRVIWMLAPPTHAAMIGQMREAGVPVVERWPETGDSPAVSP